MLLICHIANFFIFYRSRYASLNKHHAYFLLVDNGTVGKYGAEIALRRKLEKFISTQSLSGSRGEWQFHLSKEMKEIFSIIVSASYKAAWSKDAKIIKSWENHATFHEAEIRNTFSTVERYDVPQTIKTYPHCTVVEFIREGVTKLFQKD